MIIFPNIVAMVFSLVAIIMLSRVIPKIGGSIGRMIKMIVAGVFCSVFLHAGAELAEAFGLIPQEALMPVMGALITLGSIAFTAAGVIGIKSLE